jgi:hypothetical protein
VLLEPTLDAVDGRGLIGDIGTFHLDRGYDNNVVRRLCAELGRTASRTLSIPLLRRREVQRAGHAAGVNPTSRSVRSQMRRCSPWSRIAGTGGSSLMPGVVV